MWWKAKDWKDSDKIEARREEVREKVRKNEGEGWIKQEIPRRIEEKEQEPKQMGKGA